MRGCARADSVTMLARARERRAAAYNGGPLTAPVMVSDLPAGGQMSPW
jgi:hypothetical protein